MNACVNNVSYGRENGKYGDYVGDALGYYPIMEDQTKRRWRMKCKLELYSGL